MAVDIADRLIDQVDVGLAERRAGLALQVDLEAVTDKSLAGGDHPVQQLEVALALDLGQRLADRLAEDVAVTDELEVRGVGELEHEARAAQEAEEAGRLLEQAEQVQPLALGAILALADISTHRIGGRRRDAIRQNPQLAQARLQRLLLEHFEDAVAQQAVLADHGVEVEAEAQALGAVGHRGAIDPEQAVRWPAVLLERQDELVQEVREVVDELAAAQRGRGERHLHPPRESLEEGVPPRREECCEHPHPCASRGRDPSNPPLSISDFKVPRTPSGRGSRSVTPVDL